MHSFSFCPNPACIHHKAAPQGRWFVSLGFYSTKCFGNVPRYRCKVNVNSTPLSIKHHKAEEMLSI
ncbi:MAG: hypothetical protein BWX81_02307 [Spirochaetes bacterium ADurb.Bin110]|nr:MAG: hypothetical protein BWX81_02307 [Spirochaetes bacterium ADurb.Bin110]